MSKFVKNVVVKAFSPKYLLTTNTFSCTLLLGAGDYLQQKVGWSNDPDNKAVDSHRTARVACTGIVLGPLNHYWYKFLDSRIAGRALRQVLLKVAADFAVSPVFACTYIAGIALLEGKSVPDSFKEYKEKFWAVLLLDLCVWPPSQVLNFWLMPPQARVIYISTVQLFYNIFMSYIKHS